MNDADVDRTFWDLAHRYNAGRPQVKGTATYVKPPYVPPAGRVRRAGWLLRAAIAGFVACDVAGVALIILRRLGGHG